MNYKSFLFFIYKLRTVRQDVRDRVWLAEVITLMTKKKMRVQLIDIKYDGRTTYISVCGAAQLQAFEEHGYMDCYDAGSAPTNYSVEIEVDPEDVDQIIEEAQRVAEDELGLTIKSFKIIY